jgi:hypothetical protein
VRRTQARHADHHPFSKTKEERQMPDLHCAKVVAETVQGARVTTTGYSGNRNDQHYRLFRLSRAARANAATFYNYLEQLGYRHGRYGGGKTAFTCAEPQAILEALMRGATFDSICVYNIHCDGEPRRPCGAFCSQYLVHGGDGHYWLDMNEIQPPPRGGRRRPRRRVSAPDIHGWREVYRG